MRRAKRVLGGSRTWPGQSRKLRADYRYIHSVDEEVKNDYRERTYATDVQYQWEEIEGQLCWLE